MRRHEVNLTFENLEPKILLAGTVTVKETGAGMKISGDVASNEIEMARVNADTVSVTGAGGTTVNGAASGQFALGGGSVKLDFKQGGSDLVSFVGGGGADLELSKVKGGFGDGDDQIYFETTNTTQKVALKMGDGNNDVDTRTSSLRGKVTIRTGQGSDEIELRGGGVEVLGKTSIATGDGRDEVDVSGFGTTGLLAELTVKLEDGTDEFFGYSNRIQGQAAVDGGAGVDKSQGSGNTFAPGSPIVTNFELLYDQWL